jgi:hypothetical protein
MAQCYENVQWETSSFQDKTTRGAKLQWDEIELAQSGAASEMHLFQSEEIIEIRRGSRSSFECVPNAIISKLNACFKIVFQRYLYFHGAEALQISKSIRPFEHTGICQQKSKVKCSEDLMLHFTFDTDCTHASCLIHKYISGTGK